MSKKETIEEFLARGGKITKCEPAPPPEETPARIMPTPSASSTIMTLSEGALYYAESRAKHKERKDPLKSINFAALPASLLKFIQRGNL